MERGCENKVEAAEQPTYASSPCSTSTPCQHHTFKPASISPSHSSSRTRSDERHQQQCRTHKLDCTHSLSIYFPSYRLCRSSLFFSSSSSASLALPSPLPVLALIPFLSSSHPHPHPHHASWLAYCHSHPLWCRSPCPPCYCRSQRWWW